MISKLSIYLEKNDLVLFNIIVIILLTRDLHSTHYIRYCFYYSWFLCPVSLVVKCYLNKWGEGRERKNSFYHYLVPNLFTLKICASHSLMCL